MNNYKVTDYYKSISGPGSPLEKQFKPDDRENNIKPYELSDPLSENEFQVVPRLVHRYKDRVLLLVTDKCLLHCRHCFRRDYIDMDRGVISDEELDPVIHYIKNNQNIHEILLSGGDPLTLDPEKLELILAKLKSIRDGLVIRIGSRIPIVEPGIITGKVIEVLKKAAPVWLSIQCNHPDELTSQVRDVIRKLTKAGVNVVNQSVLLKGINDDSDVLKALSYKLLEFGIKPYYLFQGDLARGTSHFRVSLSRGLELVRKLRNEVSGLAMPVYAVDIPGGGGKIPLTKDYIAGEDEDYYYLKNSDGFTGKYPKE